MRAGARIALVLTCALSALSVSCTGPYAEFLSPSSEGKGTAVTELVFDNVSALSATLEVHCNTSWRIKNSAGWLSFSATSGVNDGTVTVSTNYNVTGASRTAEVYVVTDDASQKGSKLTVTQPAASLKLGSTDFSFAKTGGVQNVTLSSNTVWKAVSDTPGINMTPSSGHGDATVQVKVAANTTRRAIEAKLVVIYADSLSTVLSVKEDPLDNVAPTTPVKTYPADGEMDVSRSCRFQWKPSTDPDGDSISYMVRMSLDLVHWDTLGVTQGTYIYPSSLLIAHEKIFWTVEATDSNYLGTARSDTMSFTTGDAGVISDGTYVKYMSSTKSSPCKIIFMGDGFIDDDLMEGNSEYDRVLDEAIADYFSIAPLKDLKDYFDVWKVYAQSDDRGWSSPTHINNTIFRIYWSGPGSTALAGDINKIDQYARIVPEAADLSKVAIVVISNQKDYAGTCHMWTSGNTISMVPRCPAGVADDDGESFHSVLMHEAVGHGFGLLADEYIYYNQTISQRSADSLHTYQKYGFYLNISTSTDTLQTPWKDFLGRPDYPLVGFFEGCYYLAKGVWRSEQKSIMIDNIHYLPAWSRYVIYRRVMETAGEQYSVGSFIAQDKDRTPPSSKAPLKDAFARSSSAFGIERIPLSPPVIHFE
jgi:hypothetical protein